MIETATEKVASAYAKAQIALDAARAELAQLRAELSTQSEIVQRDWLSPIEAAGLHAENERLRTELAKLREDYDRIGRKLAELILQMPTERG